MDFYDTVGGRRFVDGTVPHLVRALDRLADALEKANRLSERELGMLEKEMLSEPKPEPEPLQESKPE